ASGAGSGYDTERSTISFTLADNIEAGELLGNAALNITGNALDNNLFGNDGANVIDGGAGADNMRGGKGNDTYIVDKTGDFILESAGEGVDLVKSSADFVLSANVENLTLTGKGNIGA